MPACWCRHSQLTPLPQSPTNPGPAQPAAPVSANAAVVLGAFGDADPDTPERAMFLDMAQVKTSPSPALAAAVRDQRDGTQVD